MADKKKAAATRKKGKRMSKKQRRQFNSIMRLAAVTISLLAVAIAIMVIAPKRKHTVIINHPQEAPDVEIAAPAITLEPDPFREDATEAPTATPEAQAATLTSRTAETDVIRAEDVFAQMAVSDVLETQELLAGSELSSSYLPVYKSADTLDKKIAVTVDDCFQVANLQTIVRTANSSGAKLTIFPIGENLSLKGMDETLKTCVFKLGYEVENHTWSHARVFRLPEFQMADEIWRQSQAVNQLLGVNYKQHFFRLMGGDGSSDQRTHNYLSQLGFKGIAEWSVSGSDSSLEACKSQLSPGQIYLFHTTDRDTGVLQEFIPYAVSQGYQLVTLNELLGYPDNEITEYQPENMPMPRAYTEDYRAHKVGDYAWNIVLMQDKLRRLGYLEMDGASTGYFGQQTAQAIMSFQTASGLPATGVADSQTQKLLLSM